MRVAVLLLLLAPAVLARSLDNTGRELQQATAPASGICKIPGAGASPGVVNPICTPPAVLQSGSCVPACSSFNVGNLVTYWVNRDDPMNCNPSCAKGAVMVANSTKLGTVTCGVCPAGSVYNKDTKTCYQKCAAPTPIAIPALGVCAGACPTGYTLASKTGLTCNKAGAASVDRTNTPFVAVDMTTEEAVPVWRDEAEFTCPEGSNKLDGSSLCYKCQKAGLTATIDDDGLPVCGGSCPTDFHASGQFCWNQTTFTFFKDQELSFVLSTINALSGNGFCIKNC